MHSFKLVQQPTTRLTCRSTRSTPLESSYNFSLHVNFHSIYSMSPSCYYFTIDNFLITIRFYDCNFWALTYSTNDFGNESRLKTSHRKYSWKCSNWSRITWYILCCSTFSFCSFFRSCNCYLLWNNLQSWKHSWL